MDTSIESSQRLTTSTRVRVVRARVPVARLDPGGRLRAATLGFIACIGILPARLILPSPLRYFVTAPLAVLALVLLGTGWHALVGLLRQVATLAERERRLLTQAAEVAAVQEQLRRQAFHDPLTGLPNRTLLEERADHALRRARRRPEQRPIMLLLDLDGFKAVNDTVGHGVGDEVLRVVAERIATCLRPGDTAARLGGDEFAVLLDEVESMDEAATVAERLVRRIEMPYRLGGRSLSLSACVGIAEGGDADATVAEMLRDADMAMYGAKSQSRGAVQVFTAELRSALHQRLHMQDNLAAALANHEMRVVYQPQVDLATRRVTAVEALVRWCSPVHGEVGPDVFIPMAEQLGLVTDIDLFVLRTACADLCRWRDSAGQALRAAINISGRDLDRPTLVDDVRRALVENMLDPWQIELELTEGVAVLQPEDAVQRLGALRALGIRIGIDDFGTGYSMFSRLRELPIDRLKIDRSFVHDLGLDDDAAAIVGSMVAMGHALGLTLVAEGVETEAALELLAKLGCNAAQGFHICRPMPADALSRWLGTTEWAVARTQAAVG